MMRRYLIGLILVLTIVAFTLIVPPAQAVEENYCTVDGELVIITELTTCITDADGQTCKVYFQNETTKCPDGCDNVTNTCSPPEFQVNLIMLLVGVLAMVFMGLMLKRKR